MERTKLYVKVNQYYGTKKGGDSMEKCSYYLVVYWESGGGGMLPMVMLDMLTYFRHNWRQCRNISLFVLVVVFCKTL